MAYQAALSPQTLQQVHNYLRQARATGRVITNRDVRDAYEAALAAEARTNLLNRQISQQQENWQRQYDENLRRYNQEWANRMEQQERTSNAQNVLGGATLLANAPRFIEGGRAIYDWLRPTPASTPTPTPTLTPTTVQPSYGGISEAINADLLGRTQSPLVGLSRLPTTGAQGQAASILNQQALINQRFRYPVASATSTEGAGVPALTSTHGDTVEGALGETWGTSVLGDSTDFLNPYAGMPALTDASSGMTSGLGGGLTSGAGATFGNLPTGYLAGGAGDVFGNLSPTFFSDTVTSGFGGDLGSLFSSWF